MTELKQQCVEALEKLSQDIYNEGDRGDGLQRADGAQLGRAVEVIFKILKPVQGRNIENLDCMDLFLQCGLCFEEWQDHKAVGESMSTYGQLCMGWTALGVQVWCLRHNCNVVHIDFEGMTHPSNSTRAPR